MALIRSGQPEKGIPLAKRAAAQENSADAYLLAGATEMSLGQFTAAREDLERAVSLNPGLPAALSFAGLARDKTGDEPGAKQAFEKALALNPDDFDANLHLAAILYREREFDAARPLLERALKLQPSSRMAQYAMALVEAGQGQTEKAVSELEKIVQEAPNWVEPHVKLASLYYKCHRAPDAERERAIVDRLVAQHRDQHASFEE
jgi:tetratricopeptide (TPR) repeat protein